MNAEKQTVSKGVFAQHVMLPEDHRSMLEALKFYRRLNYTETIKRGIELVIKENLPEFQTTGVQLEV